MRTINQHLRGREFSRPCAVGWALGRRGTYLRFYVGLLAFLVLLAAHGLSQDFRFAFDQNGSLTIQQPANGAAPQILVQPQPQLARPGEMASFLVLAADTRDVDYQWRFNGGDITGATADTLLLTNLSMISEGQYSVVLSSSFGSVTSAPAMLWMDGNGNNLPDSWELAHFGNLNQTPTGDFDGDGVSNYQEFVDGTDPASTNSAQYRLTLITDGGTVQIQPNKTSYTNGEVITLTASAQAPNSFHGWQGDVFSTANPLTVVMNTNKLIRAFLASYDLSFVNTAGGDWFNPINWDLQLVPASNDNVYVTLPVTITIKTNLICRTLNLSSNPNLNASGDLLIREGGIWRGGGVSGAGHTYLPPGAILELAPDKANQITIRAQTVENAGTVVWDGPGPMYLDSAVFTNAPAGIFEVLDAGSVLNLFGYASRFDNAGTIVKSNNVSSLVFDIQIPFNNYSNVIVQSGGFALNGGGTNGGTITVAGTKLVLGGGTFSSGPSATTGGAGDLVVGGGTANLDGYVNFAGTNRFTYGNASIKGTYFCTNNTLVVNGGIINFNAASIVTPNQLLLSSGTIGGTNSVTVLNDMEWTGGAMNGGGTTLIAPGADLNISGANQLTLFSRRLENAGKATWTGTGFIYADQSVITNRAGALFQTIDANSILNYFVNPSRFDNAGTFRRTISTNAFTVDSVIGFNNYGLVDIETGIIKAKGGFGFAQGSTLMCALGGPNPGTDYGQLQVSGSAAMNGSLVLVLTNSFVPPTNSSFTLLTAGSRTGSFTRFAYPSNEVVMGLTNTSTSVIATVLSIPGGMPHVSDLPSAAVFYAGRLLSLTAGATGSTPLNYQWTKNGAPLTDDDRVGGTHTDSLVITNAALADSGNYQLWVTNAQGLAQSTVAAVTVQAVPKFNIGGSGWEMQGASTPVMNRGTLTLTSVSISTPWSAFYYAPLYVRGFKASFTFTATNNQTGGIAFCLQNDSRGAYALGGSLGYSSITPSAALALNFDSTNTRGIALLQNGSVPSSGGYSSVGPVNLSSGNPIYVELLSTSAVFQVTLIESNTANQFATNYLVDLPSNLVGQTAYVGLTGAAGTAGTTLAVSNFSFVPLTGILVDQTNPAQPLLWWPDAIGGYTLQTSPDLSVGSWRSSGLVPQQINGHNQVAPAPVPTNAFYRLSISIEQ